MQAVKSMTTQDVDAYRFAGFDKSSARQYEPAIGIKARVLTQVEVIQLPDGSTVQTQYTLVVDGEEPLLPVWEDRLVFSVRGEERSAIVVRRRDGKDLRSTEIDHVILYAREE